MSLYKMLIRRNRIIVGLTLLSVTLVACGKEGETVTSEQKPIEETQAVDAVKELDESMQVVKPVFESKASSTPEVLEFVDVFGESYEVEINDAIPKHTYDNSKFVHELDKLGYDDDKFISRLGVDVSYHQGLIDWKKVKEAGFDFAFIRIGYRGYGKTGKIHLDKQFTNNIKNAQAAGLDVGVYFFAQAVSEDEALEEAKFVIDHLKGYDLQLPVVYDPESILDAPARTDDVSGEQFTANTIVFCDAIKKAGFKPAVYSNMLWEAYKLDLSQLPDIPIWYADYEPYPQTPYQFTYWQYSDSASVDGILGRCDVDIELIKKD